MVLASRRLSSSPGVQPCTRPSWNNPEKLLSRNTPGCSASEACCCVALQESVVVKVPTKFRSNLHRKSKEPSNVQAIICSLCSMWRSSKFAINVYVYRVTETYLNPLSLLKIVLRNVFIITFTKLDQNIPMFYKKQDLNNLRSRDRWCESLWILAFSAPRSQIDRNSLLQLRATDSTKMKKPRLHKIITFVYSTGLRYRKAATL